MLPTPFPGNGKSKSKAQNPELGDSFSSVFLWARPSDRRWLVSRTVALSRVHVLLDTRGSASWAGREIWCAAGKLPIPPSGSWSSPGRPCDPAVLLLHCLQAFGILARAEAFFPAATIQPGSVRLARGGRSRSWWRPGGSWWGGGTACLPLLLCPGLLRWVLVHAVPSLRLSTLGEVAAPPSLRSPDCLQPRWPENPRLREAQSEISKYLLGWEAPLKTVALSSSDGSSVQRMSVTRISVSRLEEPSACRENCKNP